MNKSTSVLGCVSPSGAYSKKKNRTFASLSIIMYSFLLNFDDTYSQRNKCKCKHIDIKYLNI